MKQGARREHQTKNGCSAPGDAASGNGTGGKALRDKFRFCAHHISILTGSPWAFLIAVLSVAVWAATGSVFHYSDTWQLVINTATTIVTFLMVFLIQNTQNRDTKAIHLKLDELLRGVKGARTGLVNLEELSDEDLDHLQQEFEKLRQRIRPGQKERATKVPGQKNGPGK